MNGRRAAPAGTGTGTRHRDTPPPAAGLRRPGPRLSRPSSLPSAAPRANKMMQSSALAAEGAVKGLPEILGVPVQRKDAFLFSLFRSLPQRQPRAGGAAPCGWAGASAPGRCRFCTFRVFSPAGSTVHGRENAGGAEGRAVPRGGRAAERCGLGPDGEDGAAPAVNSSVSVSV